jgi:hypothetical protein
MKALGALTKNITYFFKSLKKLSFYDTVPLSKAREILIPSNSGVSVAERVTNCFSFWQQTYHTNEKSVINFI